MADQRYMWARLDLPCPIDEIGSLDRWHVIAGDPVTEAVELLKDITAFIGWEAHVPDLVERAEAFVAAHEAEVAPSERTRGDGDA